MTSGSPFSAADKGGTHGMYERYISKMMIDFPDLWPTLPDVDMSVITLESGIKIGEYLIDIIGRTGDDLA